MRLSKNSAIRVVWFYNLKNMSKTTQRKGDVYVVQIIFPRKKKNQPEILRLKGIITAKNENKTKMKRKNKQSKV